MMGYLAEYRDERTLSFSVGELTGAIGDSVTVLPIGVATSVGVVFTCGVVAHSTWQALRTHPHLN